MVTSGVAPRWTVAVATTAWGVVPAGIDHLAAAVERYSDHPVGNAIVNAEEGVDRASGFDRHPGLGVSGRVDGVRVIVGSRSLVEREGWSIPAEFAERAAAAESSGHVPTFVGWDGAVRGLIVVGDEPREGWRDVIAEVATESAVVVISGDSEAASAKYREHPEIEAVLSEVPPEGKTEVVRRLKSRGTVAMVGDGVNDAPALAEADIGVAMGNGAAIAGDAADAVITTDDLPSVPRVFRLTRAARGRIRQNLGWAFLYNAIAIPVAAVGALNPLFAALAMASSSLVVVGNSARSLKE